MPDGGLDVIMDNRRGSVGWNLIGFYFFLGGGCEISEANEQFMHYSFMLLIPDFVFVGGYSVSN